MSIKLLKDIEHGLDYHASEFHSLSEPAQKTISALRDRIRLAIANQPKPRKKAVKKAK